MRELFSKINSRYPSLLLVVKAVSQGAATAMVLGALVWAVAYAPPVVWFTVVGVIVVALVVAAVNMFGYGNGSWKS